MQPRKLRDRRGGGFAGDDKILQKAFLLDDREFGFGAIELAPNGSCGCDDVIHVPTGSGKERNGDLAETVPRLEPVAHPMPALMPRAIGSAAKHNTLMTAKAAAPMFA